MSHYLMEMLQSSNPEAIERYVSNHLPNDPNALERIYRQLKEYKINASAPAIHTHTHQSSTARGLHSNNKVMKSGNKVVKSGNKVVKSGNKIERVRSRRAGDQFKECSDRSNAVMRLLKDKGLKVQHMNELEDGLRIFEAQKDRLTRPLQMNSKVIKAGNPIMGQLIERYNINRKFYNNDVEDVELKGEDVYDPEMKKFIERRKDILFELRQGGNKEKDRWKTSEKYSNTEHRLYQQNRLTGIDAALERKMERKSSLGALPTMTSLKSQINLSSKNLIGSCTAVLSEKMNSNKLFHQNAFLALSAKTHQSEDQEEGLFLSQEFALMQKAKMKHKKDQLQRYNHSYMKMMSHGEKVKECKLNSHAKALLKDQIRMRHVIDFSKKQ